MSMFHPTQLYSIQTNTDSPKSLRFLGGLYC
nr:MAG TPA: hypothetical protein [Caudoviricetes sp.]